MTVSFADEAIRMLRTKWGDRADLLADELYLIFANAKQPGTGPVSVDTGDTNFPGITFPPLPSLNEPPFDIPTFLADPTNPQQPQQTVSKSPDGGQETLETKQKQWYRTVTPGKVLSNQKGGLYTMRLYPYGLESEDGPTYEAKNVIQLDKDEGFAENDWALVCWIFKYQVTTTTVKKIPEGTVISTSTKLKLLKTIFFCQMGGGGGSIPGEVVSGSGDTYSVRLYPKGRANQPQTNLVTVVQQDIHPLEQIPAGSWVMVSKLGSTYVMQHPVYE